MGKEVKLVDKYCRGCEHRASMGPYGPWCDYIGDTGKPRPCPAGVGCTEYKRGKKNRWHFTLQEGG